MEWLVKPGDEVHKGDVIAVVDTAKSAFEVESFHSGTVERLVTPEGETVPVGTVLAVIRQAAPEAAKAGGKPAVPPAPRVQAAPAGAQPRRPGPGMSRQRSRWPGRQPVPRRRPRH